VPWCHIGTLIVFQHSPPSNVPYARFVPNHVREGRAAPPASEWRNVLQAGNLDVP
jgi:hypothetical protein